MGTTFQKKHLSQSKPVCLRLKELRESAGLSVEQMSQQTKLSRAYILAIEECRFSDLPKGAVYQKCFIKQYLRAAGVNPAPYLRQFMLEEHGTKKPSETHCPPIAHKWLLPIHNLPGLARLGILAFGILGIIGYLGLQVHNIVQPPTLHISSPVNGFITTQSQLTVTGLATEESTISINGKDIVANEKGQFEEEIDLVPGVNSIIVSAAKKHGKTTTQTRYVTLQKVKERVEVSE